MYLILKLISKLSDTKSSKTLAAFGQTLLALKICNARNVYYRFSALIASARMQP